MEFMNQFMPIVIYVLLAILLLVLIILVVKLFTTVDKTNAVLEDIEKKSRSLDGVFGAVDALTDTISLASDKIVDGIASLVGRLINLRKRKKDTKGEEYND